MNPNTEIDPCLDGIRPHACIKHIPLWPDNGPRMMALRVEIQTTGLCPPIQMTAKHEIVDADSRERWRAARALQLPGIPVAIVPDDLVASASLNALNHRRHITVSGRAYLGFPLFKTALDEARHHATEMLKKPNVFPSVTQCRTAATVEEIAARIGVGESMLKYARRVHDIFATSPQYKAEMEPKILAEMAGGEHEEHRPIGLGAVVSGYATWREKDANPDKFSSKKNEQLDLFMKSLDSIAMRSTRLGDVREVQRSVNKWIAGVEDDDQIEGIRQLGEAILDGAKSRAKELAQKV